MYAIIKTGGKQYRVSEGDVLNIEKLDVEAGSEVVFDEVLTVVVSAQCSNHWPRVRSYNMMWKLKVER